MGIRGKPIPPTIRQRIRQLLREGLSRQQVARITGTSKASVHRTIREGG